MEWRPLPHLPMTALAAALAAGAVAVLAPDAPLAVALAGAAGAVLPTLLWPSAPVASPADPAPAPPAPAAVAVTDTPDFALLEHMPVGVLILDAAGQVLVLNRVALDLLDRRGRARFHSSALRAPRLLEAIEAALSEGRAVEAEFSQRRGRERHLRAQVRPIGTPDPLLPDRPAAIVVIEDTTQEQVTNALHRDFVANASHELKTPLSAISGIIDTLQGHARDDPDATERFLGMMAGQAQRMQALVDDLLSLNRIELNEHVPPRTPQMLDLLVGEVGEAMQPIARRAGISLDVGLPGRATTVLGSREELCQALRNLIDNAVKYGRPGDRVGVCYMHDDPGHPGMVGLAVRDTGPGIAREHLPRLTERFYRVSVSRSRARGGTGLGLAIVKHVVNRHRGQLEIDSAPGQGSCFTVWLPIETRAAARAPGTEAEAAAAGPQTDRETDRETDRDTGPVPRAETKLETRSGPVPSAAAPIPGARHPG